MNIIVYHNKNCVKIPKTENELGIRKNGQKSKLNK